MVIKFSLQLLTNKTIITIMSFFACEVKDFQRFPSNNDLGPGSYQISKANNPKSNYAPFGSCKTRNTQPINTQPSIGPGTYKVSTEIVQPNIKKYESEHCVIIKINDEGGSQFKSNSKRFNYNKIQSDTPGPGSYEGFALQKKKRPKSLGIKVNDVQQRIRSINKRIYKQKFKPFLQPNLQADKQIVVQKQIKKAKGVMNWSLNKEERFEPIIKEQFTKEDRDKIINDIVSNKKKKRQVTEGAVFQSRSSKSVLDCTIYKTTNRYKMEIKKLIGFKDQSPAPGSYQITSPLGRSSLKNKFQFFGSTAPRFIVNEIDTEIGPGQYHPQEVKSSIKHIEPRIKTQISRSTYIQSDPTIPGPGAYQISSFNAKQKQNGFFGSLQPRFGQQVSIKQPLEKRSLSLTSCEEIQKSKRKDGQEVKRNLLENNFYFKSKKQRDCFEDKKSSRNLPFGEYNVTNNDISEKIERMEEIRDHLKNCKLQRPGFLSSEHRFKDEKQAQKTHINCWCQMKQVERKICELQSANFRSNSKRTQVFQSKYLAPPIGYYEPKIEPVLKESFNKKFSNRKNQKKFSIWKNAKDKEK